MRIRPADADEAAAISALAFRAKAHWGYDDAFMAACRPELTWTAAEVEREDVLVAEEDGVLVGTTARVGGGPDGRLWAVFVAPEHHGRGIGRALLTRLLDRARADGFASLTIGADPNAAGFYRAVGAEQVGEVESDTRAGRILPLLRFDLSRGAAASS